MKIEQIKKRLFTSFLLFFLISNMFLAMSLASGTSYASPLSYWKLDDNSNNIIHDEMGNHDGSLMNGGEYVEGKDGKAIEFDGEDDYIEVQDQSTLNPENMTLSFWMKTNDLGINPIMAKSGENEGWMIKFSTISVEEGEETTLKNALRFIFLEESGSITLDWIYGSNLTLNEWYFFVFLYNGTGMELYVNGSLMAQKDDLSHPLVISNEALTIGRLTTYPSPASSFHSPQLSTSVTHEYFSGTLDEIALFDSSLTNESIAEIYENGITLPEDEPEEDEPEEDKSNFLLIIVILSLIIALIIIIILNMSRGRGKKSINSSMKRRYPHYPQ